MTDGRVGRAGHGPDCWERAGHEECALMAARDLSRSAREQWAGRAIRFGDAATGYRTGDARVRMSATDVIREARALVKAHHDRTMADAKAAGRRGGRRAATVTGSKLAGEAAQLAAARQRLRSPAPASAAEAITEAGDRRSCNERRQGCALSGMDPFAGETG